MQSYAVYQRLTLDVKTHIYWTWMNGKEILAYGNQKGAGGYIPMRQNRL